MAFIEVQGLQKQDGFNSLFVRQQVPIVASSLLKPVVRATTFLGLGSQKHD